MVLSWALALLVQGEAVETVDAALSYLTRHQLPDGSWGAGPEGCRCPQAPTAAAPPPGTVGALVDELGHDDIARRASAEAALQRIGEAALPDLREAAGSQDSEVRERSRRLLRDLARRREAGDVELTALALYAFLAAGHTHHSTRVRPSFANAVRRGLQWLVARQDAKGAFDPVDPTAHALGTNVVQLSFQRTRSGLLLEPMQKGVACLEALPPQAGIARLWSECALLCRPSDAGSVRRKCLAELAPSTANRGDEASLCLAVIFAKASGTPPPHEWVEALNDLDFSRLDPATGYLATEALVGGELFVGRIKNWKARTDEAIRGTQQRDEDRCERGAWEAEGGRRRVEAAAYRVLTFRVRGYVWASRN